jgi:hypothetical protein
MRLRLSSALLLGSAFLFLAPCVAVAQQPDAPSPQPTDETGAGSANGGQAMEEGEEEEIVISGQRPRGSVVGDIQPEKTLNAGDVRATGASNINELLEALGPEIGSSRGRGGGRPVLLLNGQRISGFRELRDIPTEAIQRVEILPEEVALKYGYRADQRVVNIVLRQRFRSTTALASANAATEGGYAGATGDVTRLMIQRNGRTQINLHAETNGMLTESERDIDLSESATTDDREFRSLVASRRQLRGNATFNRQVLGNVAATLNTELEHSEGRSLIGLGDILLEPLDRDTRSDSAHAGLTLNWDKARWRWNVTGNADWGRSVTGTDRDDLVFTRDRSLQTSTSADLTATANGTLFRLPAGNAGATFRAGASTIDLDSERRRAGKTTSNSLGRTSGAASVNLDLPVSRRNRDFSALGNLTFNANAEIDQLSDFGTLTTIGAGTNWSPVNRLSLIASWTREEGAPTVQQLGDPIIETPGARVFDFTRGETALVTSITGGNPDLDADRRNVLKVGGNWQPFENLDLRFRADYVHQTIARPISSISVTPTIEAAFPERFVRAAPLPGETIGQLVSVDFRPVNFDSSRRDTLRLGLDFTKPLRSRRPSQAFINQMRAEFAGARGGRGQAPETPSGPPPESGLPSGGGSQGERGFRGGGRGFGGGGFGGGNRGRIQFSLTDTITFVDRVTIAPGLPKVDYLHGDAASSLGGTPRHQVEAQGGWYNNGFGARVSANWRSGTRVESLTGDDLKFSPLATFDLRLFANLGEQFDLVAKNPWLRGTQVRFEANNIFDAKPRVRDGAGNVPFNYQPDLLNPIGRTVMISIRKLFLPPPSFFRRQQQERQQQQQQQEPSR